MDITIPDVNLKNDCTTQSGYDTFSNLFASAGVKKMEKEKVEIEPTLERMY